MILGCYKVSEKAKIPSIATAYSACFDLSSCFHKDVVKCMDEYNVKIDLNVIDDYIILPARSRALIPTGLIFIVPDRKKIEIMPRSGLCWKHGITVINSPGIIDQDYTDETFVLLHNTSNVPFTIGDGDRIAQASVEKNTSYGLTVCESAIGVSSLKEGYERNGGFGSTGV